VYKKMATNKFMIRYFAFISAGFLGLVFSSLICRAQTTSNQFFTTDPLNKLKLETNSGIREGAIIENPQEILQACDSSLNSNLQGLGVSSQKSLSFDQAAYRLHMANYEDCLKKAQKSMASATDGIFSLPTRPKVLDSCRSAGFSFCFNSRLTASIVQIESPVSGTGVVIGDDGKSYLVATSRHVVDGIAKGETGDIFWQNKTIGIFGMSDVWKSPSFDLAIIRIKSKAVIPVAPIAKASIQITGQPISVAGFPLDGELNKGQNKVLRISKGSISSQASPASATDGYSIGYTAPTTAGMSGGGVFASTTCKQANSVMLGSPIPLLVGIHGRAEKSEAKGSTGFNFAVPAWTINDYPATREFQDETKRRANFGCPYGYDGRIEVFMD